MEDPTAGRRRCLRMGDDWPEFGRMVPVAHSGLSIVTRKPAGVAMGDGSNVTPKGGCGRVRLEDTTFMGESYVVSSAGVPGFVECTSLLSRVFFYGCLHALCSRRGFG